MTPNNRYLKTRQAAVVADSARKRQRCKPRDAPVLVITRTKHNLIPCTLIEGAFLYLFLRRIFHGKIKGTFTEARH